MRTGQSPWRIPSPLNFEMLYSPCHRAGKERKDADRHNDKAGRHDFDVADCVAHLSAWMMALTGKLPRHLAADGKYVGEVVAVAPALMKEGLKGRCAYPVLHDTLAGMDLSDALKKELNRGPACHARGVSRRVPRHGRRVSGALAGRDCGQVSSLGPPPDWQGEGFFSETPG